MASSMDLTHYNKIGDGYLPGLLGITVTAVGEGSLDAEFTVQRSHLAPNGYLHAGSIVTLADTACGYGCLYHLPDNMANFTTVELKTNFIGTAREGTVAVIARPVHLGATTQVWDATVRRKVDDKTIALFRCTQILLPPR